jgi:hypothetical protein
VMPHCTVGVRYARIWSGRQHRDSSAKYGRSRDKDVVTVRIRCAVIEGTGSSPNLHKDSFNPTRSSAFYDCTSNPYSHNILITASSVFSARISMLSPTPNPCVSNANCAMRHHVLSPLAASPELKTLAKLLHSVTFISVDLSAYVTKGA